jgi:hypothetical protein
MPQLRHFSRAEIYLSEMEAGEILTFFGLSTSGIAIELQDREFAQALLVEAIDASNEMGIISSLFSSSANPTSSVRSIITQFVAKSMLRWFRTERSSAPPYERTIYASIRNTLCRNWRTAWECRRNGLGILGY